MRLAVSSLNTKFSGQLTLTFGATVFLSGLGFISGALLARMLGPVARGEWAAIQLWASFWATLALIGSPEAVTYFVSKKPADYGHYWVSGTALSLIIGLPIALFGAYSLTWLLKEQTSQVIVIGQWYTVGLFVLFALNWMPLSVMRGRNQFSLWNIFRILPSLAWVLVIVSAYVFRTTSLDYLARNFLLLYAFAGAVVFLFMFSKGYKPAFPQISEWSSILRFSVPSALSTLTKALVRSGRISQLFVASFISAEALGYIFVAITWSNLSMFFPQTIAPIVFPRIAASPNNESMLAEVKRGMKLIVAIIGFTSIVQIVITPLAIPLIFGRQYSPAVSVGIIIVLATALSSIRQVANSSLRGIGNPLASFFVDLTSVIVTTAMLFVLISKYELMGAAIAMFIGDAISTIFAIYLLAHYTNLTVNSMVMPSKANVKHLRQLIGKFTQHWLQLARSRLFC